MYIEYTLEDQHRTYSTTAHTIMVGRIANSQNTLDLRPDDRVSRQHARISLRNGTFWIEDLGSRNGTRLNGDTIDAPAAFGPGDVVEIGATILRVYEATPSEDKATTPVRPDIAEALSDDTTGIVTSTMVATHSFSDLLVPPQVTSEDSLVAMRRQLQMFYKLGEILGVIASIETMTDAVIEHLSEAVPRARSVGVVFVDGDAVRLVSHRSKGKDPSVSHSLVRRAVDNDEGFIWRADEAEGQDMSMSIARLDLKSAIYAPLSWNEQTLGVIYLSNSIVEEAFTEDDLRMVMALASQTAMFITTHRLQAALKQEEVMRANFQRQFSPRVSELLMQQGAGLQLGGEQIDPVTILMSDVRGFTAHTQKMAPAHVIQVLNEMFDLLIPIVFDYDGTVDKFVGDAILAVFGSPEQDDNQCEKAVRAALDMQRAMAEYGHEWQIGIGIHTGPVVLGFIGAAEQIEYTVVGDTVNKASRYVDGAPPGQVLISKEVYEKVRHVVEVEARAPIQTKHAESEPELENYVVLGLRE
jgi:adenylate cyclase